tara:strand:+ start:199 stop:627 length:429 start_codon:yes stop_codon:yes gene_type:complete
MFNKKVKSRIIVLIFILILSAVTIFVVLKSLKDNIVYFLSPTEIYNKSDIKFDKKIRVGGLVKLNSIKRDGNKTNFIITDLKNEIIVTYKGLVPNLFSEEKGVIAEGKLKDKKFFVADKILAKHDENYMPPEVAEALENSKN